MGKEYMEIFLGGIGMIFKTNFTTNKHMARIRFKHKASKEFVGSSNYANESAKPWLEKDEANDFSNRIWKCIFEENHTKQTHKNNIQKKEQIDTLATMCNFIVL